MKKALLFALALPLSYSVLATDLATAQEASQKGDPKKDRLQEDRPKWYQADMIVFRYVEDSSNEAWPPVAPHPLPSNALSLLSPQPKVIEAFTDSPPELAETSISVAPDIDRDAFIRLPQSDFLLNKEASALRRSGRYDVLSQVAWRMPVDNSLQEQPVVIHATSITNTETEGGGFLLSGTVTVSASRYLHADMDLWFNELTPALPPSDRLSSGPSPQWPESPKNSANRDMGNALEHGIEKHSIEKHSIEAPTASSSIASSNSPMPTDGGLNSEETLLSVVRNFQLKEKRRIKTLDEMQYLDSPVIGVLFKLTAYQRPPSAEEGAGEGDQAILLDSLDAKASQGALPLEPTPLKPTPLGE